MRTDAEPVPLSPEESGLTRSDLNFPVVGIGASAGGLEALIKFFEQMPADNGMAFVVILHLSPKHESNLDSLLQAATKMPVVQVTQPTPVQANHVYVIPPTKNLSMNDGYLRVGAMDRPRGRHVTIDLFFRSLAVVHAERAVAIVLSGTGSDGAVGIKRIKEQGGITFAQNPDDAHFDDMPRAAIATDMIDWVMPVVEMPQKLVELWANARAIQLPKARDLGMRVDEPPTPEAMKEAEDALRNVMSLLRVRTGHDFKHYKRATVLRRLERRLQVNGLPNLPAYREFMSGTPQEADALLKDLLIGVSNFFRDREAFEALEREVIPQLFALNGDVPVGDGAPPEPVRAWVAGCASGEEAYSVAMLLSEYAAERPGAPPIQLFATDIDEQAVSTARVGSYPESIVTDVSPARLRQFFTKEGDRYRVRKELRERVLFAIHNVLRDPPFSHLHLISCRNLLIYLDRSVHAQILETFHFALRPGGYLFLGSSESADASPQLFSVVDKKNRIYRANAVMRSARNMPAVTAGIAAEARLVGPRQPAERRQYSYADVHRELAEQHAPPSVLIDSESHIVHLSEQAGRFLVHAAGPPSHHLPTLVLPELRLELRTALHQARATGKSVEARRVQIERGDKPWYINMVVRPVPAAEKHGPLVLVLFDEVEVAMSAEAAAQRGERDPVLAQLEEDLRRTQEQLRETIEEAETTTEELKASNEELQAINEELRSTTEELETSKEELQSINEELITVNQELKMKVEETGKINDDLQNLIASTDIATVFVDRGLTIKRYTPRTLEIFSMIPGDVGRSLLDINHRLDYPQLADDAAEALQSLRLIEREVSSSDDRWYLARALPYRTTEDRIDGVVLTFVDITSRRRAEERMRLAAQSTRDFAILTLDLDGAISTWNAGAERMFGYADAEAVGMSGEMLFVPEDRVRGVPAEEMRRAHAEGRAEDERWHLRKDGTRFYVSGVMTPLYDGGVLRGYSKIARDLTNVKHDAVEREERVGREAAGRAEAGAAVGQKDEFLAIMSHELKNPLNLILLNAELLARIPEARTVPSVVRAAEIIRKTVRSQAKIIDDLLDLSRINTGKMSLNATAVDWSLLRRQPGRGGGRRGGQEAARDPCRAARSAGGGARRPGTGRADRVEPAEQRDEVHAVRRAHHTAAASRGRLRCARSARHRARHLAAAPAQGLRHVPAG